MNDSDQTQLSIIIVNWNGELLLKQNLNSIYKNPPSCRFEVLVADNNSSDDSVKMVEEDFSQVILVKNRGNLGFGKANNQALKLVSGKIILFLNPDTTIEANTLDDCISQISNNPKIGILGCRHILFNGENQSSCGHFPSLSMLFKQNMIGFLLKLKLISVAKFISSLLEFNWPPISNFRPYWSFTSKHNVDWVAGSFIMAREEVLSQLDGDGVFDERFFLYAEDIDICRRVKLDLKYEIVYLGTSTINHADGGCSASVKAPADAAHYIGMIKFYQKHYGVMRSLIYRLILLLAFTTKLILKIIRQLIKGTLSSRGFELEISRINAVVFSDYKRTLNI